MKIAQVLLPLVLLTGSLSHATSGEYQLKKADKGEKKMGSYEYSLVLGTEPAAFICRPRPTPQLDKKTKQKAEGILTLQGKELYGAIYDSRESCEKNFDDIVAAVRGNQKYKIEVTEQRFSIIDPMEESQATQTVD